MPCCVAGRRAPGGGASVSPSISAIRTASAGAMQHASLQAGPAASVGAVGVKGSQRSTAEALALLTGEDTAEDGALELQGAASLWFKKEAFTAAEFDPDEYVRDLRRYVRAKRPSMQHTSADPTTPRRCRWRRCAPPWTRT